MPTGFITFIVGLTLIGLAITGLVTYRAPDPSGALEYKDLISILLTAVTVVLAVLGIGIAILAIWGYKEFMTKAESKAEEAASKIAKELVNTYLTSEEFTIRFTEAVQRLHKDEAALRVKPAGQPEGKGVQNAGVQENFPTLPQRG